MSNKKIESKISRDQEKSQVTISAEVPAESVERYRPSILKRIQKNINMDGFRKGHVPIQIIEKRLGAMTIWQEMAEEAIKDNWKQIISENKIEAIGTPEIVITKISPGTPLSFTITTAIMPTIDLPDYKKIAKNIPKENEDMEIKESEINEILENIRKNWQTNQTKDGNNDEKKDKVEEGPVLNDDFAKKLGKFETIKDLRMEISKNLQKEKEHKAKEKVRMKLAEAILKETKIDLPGIIIESELERMWLTFKADIEGLNFKIDEYLKNINKTEENLKKEWREDAKKRASLGLVINEIFRKEKIKLDGGEIKSAVSQILLSHPDLDEKKVTAHVSNSLLNEKVFQFLEDQSLSSAESTQDKNVS